MFIVRTRDAYGNDRASGGDAVTATLMQAGTAEVVHANVTDTGEGSYSVRYKLVVTDGKDYTFLSDDRFDAMVEGGEFIEWANVGGQRYGTSVAGVREGG